MIDHGEHDETVIVTKEPVHVHFLKSTTHAARDNAEPNPNIVGFGYAASEAPVVRLLVIFCVRRCSSNFGYTATQLNFRSSSTHSSFFETR